MIETERLIARPLVDEDFAALHGLTSDPAVMRFVGDLRPYTAAQTREFIAEAQASYAEHGFGAWAILDKATGELCGFGGLEMLPERKIPEVAYIFAPAYWGRGLATEFAAAVLEYGFRTLRLPEIGASFDPDNHPSMRVASKLGLSFSYEGVDEFNLPTIYYAMPNPFLGE
ncbi:MAG: GNAT family N-acetyltransferase [Chloroflexi bacterium]|nr:GNAT family N-acetyltransferase [Chloroflexota bacterium]